MARSAAWQLGCTPSKTPITPRQRAGHMSTPLAQLDQVGDRAIGTRGALAIGGDGPWPEVEALPGRRPLGGLLAAIEEVSAAFHLQGVVGAVNELGRDLQRARIRPARACRLHHDLAQDVRV